MHAEDWPARGSAFRALAGERTALVRGKRIPCRIEDGYATLSLAALPEVSTALVVAGGGTAGVCAALDAAEEGCHVRRLALATEEGLICVAPQAVIDATGTGEVAAYADCAMTFGDAKLDRMQNYSQWRICDRA